MSRLVIIGGGISGLIANWIFRSARGLDVKVIEASKLGGDFLAGGLKYIHRTDEMAALLQELGVVYTNYNVQGGVLLRGKVEPYPGILKDMSKDAADRIRDDHYRKTRGTEPDAWAVKAMNDPEASGPRKSLRCDLGAVVQALVAKCSAFQEIVTRIEEKQVITKTGLKIPYDYLIVTIPLWITRRIAHFQLPEALAMKLNLVQVDQIRDRFAKWDFVYTPYTPENLVHRVSPHEGGMTCEFNGAWEDGEEGTSHKLTNELNFLFPEGWALQRVVKDLNGHLLPLKDKAGWPDNVRPLGRFAEWNTRATADVVLNTCYKLAEEWKIKITR